MEKITIVGAPPSKANMYKIISIGGHGSLCKTNAMKDWERSFFIQCQIREKMITGYFKVEVDVFYPTMRQDLDNVLKGFLDCLQSCKVIKNDNQCVEIHARKFIDKVNPRIEFTIDEIGM